MTALHVTQPMKIYKVFQRLTCESRIEDIDELVDVDEWSHRMDQLLLSDPTELASFISDALIALAAKAKDDVQDRFETAINVICEAGSGPERDDVVGMVKMRFEQMIACMGEHGDTEQMLAGAYKASREGKWPDE